MEKVSIEERVERLRWYGFNPIHLWGRVYLVRHRPTWSSDWPIYFITVFKE
jgi:hypothetical protein